NFGTFLLGEVVVALDFFHRGLINDRASKVGSVERVSDPDSLGCGDKFLRVPIENLLGDQNPSRGNASLAACLECANDAAVYRQVQAGILADDNGTFAPHLAGDNSVVVLGGELLNAAAHVVAAGKQDNIDSRILHQTFAGRPFAVNQVDRPRGE